MAIDKQFYYKNNRLQQVKGFVNVIKQGGVKQAAIHMGIAQSAVSTQISSLEEALNTKLFDRKGKKLVLTEDGQAFYEMSIPFLQGFESLFEEFINKKKEGEENHLKISAHQYVTIAHVPSIIHEVIKLNKGIDVTVFNMPKDVAIRKVIDKEIDVCFFDIQEQDYPELECKKIIEEPFVLAFNKNRKHLLDMKDTDITWDIIMEEGLLVTNTYYGLKRPKHIADAKHKVTVVDVTYEMVRNMVKHDLGVSYCPLSYIQSMDREFVREKDITHIAGKYKSYIIYTRQVRYKKCLLDLINILSKSDVSIVL